MTTLSGTITAARAPSVAAAILLGVGAVMAAQLLVSLVLTGGRIVYVVEAPYTDLALAQQILHGHYGLSPDEAAAPSSSILYPFLLAALLPLGAGGAAPLIINILATLAAGLFAVMLAEECNLPLHQLGWLKLAALSVVITVALNLSGLVMTGLEHSLHVALTIVYLLGLVRFSRRGRCDWWWFACILIQPLLRFEAAGMLVADVMIFLAFRRYSYAALTLGLGLLLVGGYSWFLHSLGLPLLPSSVLSRSDWSNAAVENHAGLLAVGVGILRNFIENLNSFGAAQILGIVVLAWVRMDRTDRTKLMTAFFITFVSVAQLVGGKIGSQPPRYEAYVLALGLCGLAVIHGEALMAWCARASWPRVGAVAAALVTFYAGYATQSLMVPSLARKEYAGPFQLHRFVTDFYREPVATGHPGYVSFDQSFYVLDLSGLASEEVRRRRAGGGIGWMDDLLASRGISLALVDSGDEARVPADWTAVVELRSGADYTHHVIAYARRPADVPAIRSAFDRFAPTLPGGVQLIGLTTKG
jgi:hypothetical protein